MFPSLLVAPVFGILIGLALGMLGGGGSILTVPVLVYVLGQSPHSALATSLIIVGANAIFGTWMHARNGHVKWRQALIFGALGVPAAFLGAQFSQLLPETLLMICFALLMLVIATLMLRGGIKTTADQAQIVWWKVALGGLGVGFLTGFLGVGGGFLIVPALVLLLGMEMPDAVGSSLVVITINSLAGLFGHLGETSLPWGLIGVFVSSGVIGLLAGTRISQLISPKMLRSSFASFVFVLACVLLLVNGAAVFMS